MFQPMMSVWRGSVKSILPFPPHLSRMLRGCNAIHVENTLSPIGPGNAYIAVESIEPPGLRGELRIAAMVRNLHLYS
jgi:hypothetical protein